MSTQHSSSNLPLQKFAPHQSGKDDAVDSNKHGSSRRPFQRLSSNADRTIVNKKNPIKQSVNFVRKSINEEEISKEEHSCEQSNLNIFRQASWAQDANSEMEDMWTLKRANSVFSVLDLDDDELDAEAELYASPTKRARTQVISWTDKVSEESSCLFFTSAVPSITAGGKLSPQKSVAPKCA